jgi:transcriptional regulator with XRE-family HTH domain
LCTAISRLLIVYYNSNSLGNKIASFGNFLPLVRVIPSDTLRLKISFFMKEKNIPNSIKRYRKARGLQQKDVAKVLGLKSASMISRWEKGLCLPNTRNLFKLAILYRTMSDALFIDMIKQMRNEIQKREQRVLRKNENNKGRSKQY